MIKFLAILITLLTSETLIQESNSFDELITITYSGDQSKPFPQIVIYYEGSYSKKNENDYNLKIPKNRFESMQESILNLKECYLDSMLQHSRAYQLSVLKKGEAFLYVTPYLTRIRQVFKCIQTNLTEQGEEKAVSAELDSILQRLLYENNFK